MVETVTTAKRPLDGVRVIDLADERGELCGRLLADLGADVLRVEPPAGGVFQGRSPRPHVRDLRCENTGESARTRPRAKQATG